MRWFVHNVIAHPLLILCPPLGRWLHELTAPEPVDPPGESCMDCGRSYPLWWADSTLFNEVTGGWYGPGLLCPDCFDQRAQAQGTDLVWVPRRWDDEAKAWMEQDAAEAIEAWRRSPEYRAEKALRSVEGRAAAATHSPDGDAS